MKTPKLTSIRTRLTVNTLLVLLIGMGLAAFLAWRVVEALYLETQRENLLAQANLTAAALQGQPLPASLAQPYSQTSNVMPGIHTRLLNDQGVVIQLPLSEITAPPAESDTPISPGELQKRPEIAQAMQGQAATAIRTVQNHRVLYAAAPVWGENGVVTGLVYLATPLPAASLPASALLQLGGVLAVAVLLAGIAGAWLARRIARPLEGVARAAEAVAAGRLDTQVPIESGISELDSLGTSFNTMTTSLRQSDQAKNAFIADVTHELRTPLTVIKGTIETLEDGALDDAEGRGPLLASMQRETDRLIRLVHDLLVLTRADAGALKLNRSPVDVSEVARARCRALAALAEAKQVVLRVETPPQPSPPENHGRGGGCLADPDRLAQIFDNLLDNAIRYAPPDSAVTVCIISAGDELRCTVSDDGPGIPAEHLPHIFERFYRVDASRSRHTGGAGLGLAIVKALVTAHGGRIQAESVEGQGTTITFWLPEGENCHSID
jgi:signal transduction histidine kinase